MTDKTTYRIDSLARRMRPRTFEEVAGQVTVLDTLMGMIKRKEIPNAIMFTGASGTGKTTLAGIFARYLNCENGTNCGTCKSCLYPENQHPDIKFLNAATERGIDEIRTVIEGAKYMPRHNVRIIIMDEAHQLTGPATEALLIPLENPPANTMYIMCTTDPQKFAATFIGRCTVLPLSVPSKGAIGRRLHNIAKSEKIKLTREVILAMAEASNGCVREAVNILERAANILAVNPKIDEASLIKTVNSTVSDTANTSATNLLLGLYQGKSAQVAAAVFSIDNTVQTLNAAIYMNQYVIGSEVANNSKHVWHSPANRDFRTALSKVAEERRTIKAKLAVHKKLVDLRNAIHNVPTGELSMLLAHLG